MANDLTQMTTTKKNSLGVGDKSRGDRGAIGVDKGGFVWWQNRISGSDW